MLAAIAPWGECVANMDQESLQEWSRLKAEHTSERDGSNNYGCFNIEACRGCNFVQNSRGCISCHGCNRLIECVQCVGCSDCAFSVGLKNARFHILNKEYVEVEYYQRLTELGVDWSVDALRPEDDQFE